MQACQGQLVEKMIEKKHLKFLINHKTRDHYHSNRCLLDHFIGTYNLLSLWGNCETINVAGLFHSIYGVKSKYSKPERFNLREEVQSVIGIPSERLVYLFCSLERGRYLTPEFNGIDVWEHKALIEIEAANIVEQAPYITKYFNDTIIYIEKIKNVMYLLSPKGRDNYQKFLNMQNNRVIK